MAPCGDGWSRRNLVRHTSGHTNTTAAGASTVLRHKKTIQQQEAAFGARFRYPVQNTIDRIRDALAGTFRELRLPRDPECPGCGALAAFGGYEDIARICSSPA